jgi:hypothetical protein
MTNILFKTYCILFVLLVLRTYFTKSNNGKEIIELRIKNIIEKTTKYVNVLSKLGLGSVSIVKNIEYITLPNKQDNNQ